ncbi:MAG: hypothetical protein ACFB0F_01700 [Neomegalonema sp.]
MTSQTQTETEDQLQGLRSALQAIGLSAAPEPMPDTGLAHAHYRLPGTGWIARVPKQSQMQLEAADNLAYQSACYTRASISGHAPKLAHLLPPKADLPRGALIVEEIIGRPARLPEDLEAIMIALAAIHALPTPAAAGEHAPLLAPADPLRDLLEEIEEQSAYIAAAGVAPETEDVIQRGVEMLRTLALQEARPSKRLISFDAHPGNFLIDSAGKAVLVDLEKCRYSAPQLDIAHATLYTSTTWDVQSHAVLSVEEAACAHDWWLGAIGSRDWAQDARSWLLPMRRAMWLWSLTWCAKWRVLSGRAAKSDVDGEDWSAEQSDAALVAHVADRVDHYLSPETVEMVDAGFEGLDAVMGHP